MSESDQVFTITLDGRDYQIEMYGNSVLVNGVPFIAGFEGDGVTIDGVLHQVVLRGDVVEVDGETFSVAFDGLGPLSATGVAPVRPAVAAAADVAAEGQGVITAIMPGKVIRVFVNEGEEIAEGDVAVILEAMKMENELRADRDGVVKQVAVAPGDDVELGQVLVLIE